MCEKLLQLAGLGLLLSQFQDPATPNLPFCFSAATDRGAKAALWQPPAILQEDAILMVLWKASFLRMLHLGASVLDQFATNFSSSSEVPFICLPIFLAVIQSFFVGVFTVCVGACYPYY